MNANLGVAAEREVPAGAGVATRAVRTLATGASTGVAAISGIAPHVLHHIGPLAGTALLAGTGGTLLFGIAGFALSIPMLLRLRRRFGTWAAPAVATAIFYRRLPVQRPRRGPRDHRGAQWWGGTSGQPVALRSRRTSLTACGSL